jgi:hypothetical protein
VKSAMIKRDIVPVSYIECIQRDGSFIVPVPGYREDPMRAAGFMAQIIKYNNVTAYVVGSLLHAQSETYGFIAVVVDSLEPYKIRYGTRAMRIIRRDINTVAGFAPIDEPIELVVPIPDGVR